MDRLQSSEAVRSLALSHRVWSHSSACPLCELIAHKLGSPGDHARRGGNFTRIDALARRKRGRQDAGNASAVNRYPGEVPPLLCEIQIRLCVLWRTKNKSFVM